jgi:hypothetical protein
VVVMVVGRGHKSAAWQLQKVRAKGRLKHFAGKGCSRVAEGNLTAVKAKHLLPRAGLIQIMGRDQQRYSAGRERLKQSLKLFARDCVKPCEWFVEQKNPRAAGKCCCDLGSAALPA